MKKLFVVLMVAGLVSAVSSLQVLGLAPTDRVIRFHNVVLVQFVGVEAATRIASLGSACALALLLTMLQASHIAGLIAFAATDRVLPAVESWARQLLMPSATFVLVAQLPAVLLSGQQGSDVPMYSALAALAASVLLITVLSAFMTAVLRQVKKRIPRVVVAMLLVAGTWLVFTLGAFLPQPMSFLLGRLFASERATAWCVLVILQTALMWRAWWPSAKRMMRAA